MIQTQSHRRTQRTHSYSSLPCRTKFGWIPHLITPQKIRSFSKGYDDDPQTAKRGPVSSNYRPKKGDFPRASWTWNDAWHFILPERVNDGVALLKWNENKLTFHIRRNKLTWPTGRHFIRMAVTYGLLMQLCIISFHPSVIGRVCQRSIRCQGSRDPD
jgi:hypothetical protein